MATCEASTGSGDATIDSLADVVSHLASEGDASAEVLWNLARTLQRGVQAEIRRLCTPWGVQPTEKKATGKYGKRIDGVHKTSLRPYS